MSRAPAPTLRATALVILALALGVACAGRPAAPTAVVEVNDVQSRLNPTRVARVVTPTSIETIRQAVLGARRDGLAVSISGGRHAMGGQQFGAGTVLIDMSEMTRIIRFDPDRGLVEAEAGIQWPALMQYLREAQAGRTASWGIVQKQTGADRLSLGGALSANVHGRGLSLKPIIQDVESFTLVDAEGRVRRCSRAENPDLFRLAIGGYGLFGVIAGVELRLGQRRRIERVVEVLDIEALVPAFEKRIAEGYLYGDFQYATDASSETFLRRGVFSCYRPVSDDTPVPEHQAELSQDQWDQLYYLSHVRKGEAFQRYADYYLSTSGQIYWSDEHQLGRYDENYHRVLDVRLASSAPATEMITEIYVPRAALAGFMADVREDFRRHDVNVIYGTVRLIERDDESFLAWAREPWICVIFNLHVEHTPAGQEEAAAAFRRLIDLAIGRGGSYYLTYHRWATREQVERCHPRFAEFLQLKRKHDPEERFQSEWYRHYRRMFAAAS